MQRCLLHSFHVCLCSCSCYACPSCTSCTSCFWQQNLHQRVRGVSVVTVALSVTVEASHNQRDQTQETADPSCTRQEPTLAQFRLLPPMVEISVRSPCCTTGEKHGSLHVIAAGSDMLAECSAGTFTCWQHPRLRQRHDTEHGGEIACRGASLSLFWWMFRPRCVKNTIQGQPDGSAANLRQTFFRLPADL